MEVWMLKYPLIAPHLLARYIPNEGLFLLSERNSDVLVGEVFGSLLPLLDGSHSVDMLLDNVGGSHPEAEILYALELLERNGGIVEGTAYSALPRPSYWSAREGIPRKCCIEIVNYSVENPALFEQLLKEQGLYDPSGEPFLIVWVDDYLDPILTKHNQMALAAGTPWMIAKPAGTIVWLGPILQPGSTACWECLADRLRLNRRVLRFVERRSSKEVRLPLTMSPATRSLAASLIVTELGEWLSGEIDPAARASLMTFDTVSRSFESHPVIRRPQCHACGIARFESTSIALDLSATLPVSRDGGFRSKSAEQTFDALKQHISPVTGVVSHLHKINSGNDYIHVYIAGQNFGSTGGTLALLNESLRNRSSGKGVTDIQAKTSAVCESIERYSGVFQGYEPYKVASFSEIAEEAIHPNDCMLFSDTQYRERAARNVGADGFTWIPQPLDSNQRLWWSPVWSLSGECKKYLPTAYLYYHSEALADPIGVWACAPDSNGNAAGVTYSEAILQGLLELVERDSVALWWYPRTLLPAVDLRSFSCDFLDMCLDYYASIGREIWVLDATSDLKIPTFIGVSRKLSGPEQIVMGFGSHVDAKVAIQRTVAETNQLLAGVEARVHTGDSYDDATSLWLRQATIASEYYLRPREGEIVTADRFHNASTDISAALEQCLSAIRKAGLDAFVLDQSRPDIELKVVKVLSPGLRHFWERLAPGRLYEVPVKLGRVSTVLAERDLNPTPMFL
jgi:oxazoline/thiazoline synthase